MTRLAFCFTAVALLAIVTPATAAPVRWKIANGGNGHFYDLVSGQIAWTDAKALAEATTFLGVSGHLATITSQAESDFIEANLPPANPLSDPMPVFDRLWLGGFQDLGAPDYVEPGGGWRWVTGELWDYTNWQDNEPNDFSFFPGENYLDILPRNSRAAPLKWNDSPNEIFVGGDNTGYYIEFPVPIPEPSALALSAISLLGLVFYRATTERRRRREQKGGTKRG